MVLARPLLRRLRPPTTICIRSIGTSNLRAPESSSPDSTGNPSNPSNQKNVLSPSSNIAPAPTSNPVLERYRAAQRAKQQDNPQTIDASQPQEESLASRRGRLSSNSIFSALRSSGTPPDGASSQKRPQGGAAERNLDTLAAVLDPRPDARRRWERKMVIRSITRRGRLSKAEVIKTTEREITVKSDLLRTSMKKLQPLATQISGKRVEDAIAQMRFSKKKNAIAVRAHLQEALDRAIVERGMGLGNTDAQGNKISQPTVVVRDREGNRKVVRDHSGIYISQAWTNKGSYGQDALPRARGRVDRLRLPQTSISVLLKEERTLVREHRDKMARLAKKKVWTPLPDRPIQEQRQHYCW